MASRWIAYFAFSRNSGRILPQSRDGAGLKLFSTSNCDCSDMKDPVGITEPYIPPYQEKIDEPIKLKKARLLYQSRKRGMLENGLILSTFAAKYLDSMDPKTLSQYDRLINLPSNDWDIYYWATGVKETPVEFDTPVMKLLKEHIQNKDRESRIHQPALY